MSTESIEHPIEALFRLLERVGPYPPRTVPVPERIPGLAFFPGGSGIWGTTAGSPTPPWPLRGIMVLAHNFDSEAGFKRSLGAGTENDSSPTWGPLLKLLGRHDIPRNQCWFTNAYMGLIQGEDPMGIFPGSLDSSFRGKCEAFFMDQLRIQRPALILTLGKHVPAFLAPLSPDLAGWQGLDSLPKIDRGASPFVPAARFGDLPPVPIAALTHPCMRHLNIPRRSYGGHKGEAAEAQLIRDALKAAGLREFP